MSHAQIGSDTQRVVSCTTQILVPGSTAMSAFVNALTSTANRSGGLSRKTSSPSFVVVARRPAVTPKPRITLRTCLRTDRSTGAPYRRSAGTLRLEDGLGFLGGLLQELSGNYIQVLWCLGHAEVVDTYDDVAETSLECVAQDGGSRD